MSIPDRVAVKFDVYTLFCRSLLEHLQPLKSAVRTDDSLSYDQCYQYLNDVLQKRLFLKEDPSDLQHAVQRVEEMLLSDIHGLKNRNPEVVEVFQDIVEAAKGNASDWSYQDDLEALHQYGRQMAYCFYEDSPYSTTQARLDQTAQLFFLYEEGAELSFRANYPIEDPSHNLKNVILVRFNFDCNFELYLSYPFLFMHEYIAHIFAFDYNNEQFNDGWLLHAADAFLSRQGWNLNLDPPPVREQISAFGEHLYARRINQPIPREACAFTRNFDIWLNDPDRFQEITWGLASFEPRETESDFWPDRFINRLTQAFEHDRELLRRQIESAPNLRALFETLSPV